MSVWLSLLGPRVSEPIRSPRFYRNYHLSAILRCRLKISLLAYGPNRGRLNLTENATAFRECVFRARPRQPKVSNMKRGIRFLSRAVAIALLLSAGIIPPSSPSARTPTTTPEQQDAIANRYEVRLRKLHLVRPDLILYPICYDVYC